MYSEHLDLTTLNNLLQTTAIGRAATPNEVWDEIDSTNNRALKLGTEGAPHGVIVAARQQTAGRGRQGRTWVSPPDSGLYISFLLRPQVQLTHLPLISLATGTAVARAIEFTCGARTGLKWVNDIIYQGKKLGGILAEMPDRSALVIGIGINLRVDEETQSDELANRTISLEHILEHPVDVNALAAALAKEVERAYELLVAGEKSKIVNEWKEYSVTIGKEIHARVGNELLEGTAVGVDLDGALILRTGDGDRHLHAGEVTIRRPDGSYA